MNGVEVNWDCLYWQRQSGPHLTPLHKTTNTIKRRRKSERVREWSSQEKKKGFGSADCTLLWKQTWKSQFLRKNNFPYIITLLKTGIKVVKSGDFSFSEPTFFFLHRFLYHIFFTCLLFPLHEITQHLPPSPPPLSPLFSLGLLSSLL